MPTKNFVESTAMSDNVKERAQQIWLAGLGAFAKAQQDGTKAFEKLVSDGISMQRKAQSTAEEKLAEATQAAHTFSERATSQWGKLEGIFEERVARALHSLGAPSAAEIQTLRDRVASLEAQLGKRPATKAPAKTPSKTPSKTPAKKAAKKAPAKKAPTKRAK